jgi:hypothetical protein
MARIIPTKRSLLVEFARARSIAGDQGHQRAPSRAWAFCRVRRWSRHIGFLLSSLLLRIICASLRHVAAVESSFFVRKTGRSACRVRAITLVTARIYGGHGHVVDLPYDEVAQYD